MDEKEKKEIEPEKQNYKRRRPKKSGIINILKKLSKKNKKVTIIIKSGANCCELTGCIIDIKKNCVKLLTNKNNTCRRIFIDINCICAVIVPARKVPPPPPPNVCECQVTGAGITGPPPNNASIQLAVCTGCTPEQSLVRYKNNIDDQDVELQLLPPGPGEIFSVSCEDDQAAVIEGEALVTIAGSDFGLCEFVLRVTDTPPPAPDTIEMEIFCDDQLVHASGELDLLGQSINIIEC